jgi:hypothetical protein
MEVWILEVVAIVRPQRMLVPVDMTQDQPSPIALPARSTIVERQCNEGSPTMNTPSNGYLCVPTSQRAQRPNFSTHRGYQFLLALHSLLQSYVCTESESFLINALLSVTDSSWIWTT